MTDDQRDDDYDGRTVLDFFGVEDDAASSTGKPKRSHRSARQRFDEFHSANPHVYELLRDLALQVVRRGRRKIGLRMLWERMRWELVFETEGGGGCKLNDHFTRDYSRLLMQQEPALRGVFELRGE